jgi:DNA invertase Pin-like site-specific DNA recombinase
MKVAAYVRVSTDSQTPDNQLLGITQLCELRGWKLVGFYSEHASAIGNSSLCLFERNKVTKCYFTI